MESIDELAAEVARRLQHRGFVHDDPRAYRAGVDDAVRAIRLAAQQVMADRAATDDARGARVA